MVSLSPTNPRLNSIFLSKRLISNKSSEILNISMKIDFVSFEHRLKYFVLLFLKKIKNQKFK